MADRLTAQLNESSVERLRTLAGGERKVGAFLVDVTTLLWEQREILQEMAQKRFYLNKRMSEHYRRSPRIWIRRSETGPINVIEVKAESEAEVEAESVYAKVIEDAAEELRELSEKLVELQYKVDEMLMANVQDTPIDRDAYFAAKAAEVRQHDAARTSEYA